MCFYYFYFTEEETIPRETWNLPRITGLLSGKLTWSRASTSKTTWRNPAVPPPELKGPVWNCDTALSYHSLLLGEWKQLRTSPLSSQHAFCVADEWTFDEWINESVIKYRRSANAWVIQDTSSLYYLQSYSKCWSVDICWSYTAQSQCCALTVCGSPRYFFCWKCVKCSVPLLSGFTLVLLSCVEGPWIKALGWLSRDSIHVAAGELLASLFAARGTAFWACSS